MTTTVSLASRDFIVVGCDSLATYSKPLVDPGKFEAAFFNDDGSLRLDPTGVPVLQTADQLWQTTSHFPVNQLPSVTKIYDLMPKKAALLFAGSAQIGNHSVKNLVEAFKDSRGFKEYKKYTIEGLASRLHDFLLDRYTSEYPTEWQRPTMEILLSGYSTSHREPEIYRVVFEYDWNTATFKSEYFQEVQRGQYKVLFGGQYDVIQRVVMGIDLASWAALKSKSAGLLRNYRTELQSFLQANGVGLPIPDLDPSDPKYDLFSGDFGGVRGVLADVSSLSEQAGIDFVSFLINTMIKAQEFSSSIPTVGGKIHVGLISSGRGFQWISREEYTFDNYSTPKHVGNHKSSE